MPWYIYSFIALFSGSFYALAQKWALNLKISRERLLLYLFSGSFLVYFAYNLKDLNLLIHRPDFHILLAWGLLIASLSFAGNLVDTYAVQICPNPAYAQGMKSTNAILITISSVILFGAPLSWTKILGMVIISAGFLPLLLSKNKKTEGNWKLPAVGGLFIFTAMILLVKFVSNMGFKAQEILLVLFFFASIGYIILNLLKKKPVAKPEKLIWLALVLAIIFAFVSNLANFTAIKVVPNAGYSQAVFNSAIALTLVLSYKLFPKDQGGDFNLTRWIGVILVVIGIVLVVL